ncbi:unnamed protein product [Moneuplotes crassus]|uniref:EGF-like domain-containing protein n=1 Tax=Euplotes crassus TaxID=5936 RepID=A0AAD1Y4B0_EUPCR|nr:unnamed protein product [Moneuplotes crassus]
MIWADINLSNMICQLGLQAITHPTNPEEFLEFKNMEIYGFTMHKFPTIDGILAVVSEFSRLQISYIELDATTQKERKRNLIFEQENTSPPELDAMIHLKVNVEDIDPANGHYNIFFEESGIYTKFSSEANISGGNKCYLVKYSTKYKKVLFMRSGEERNDINHIQNSFVLDNGNVSIGIKGEEKRDIQNTDYSEQNPIEFHEPCIAVYSSRSLIWEGCYGTKFSTKQVYSDIHANRVYLLWQEFDIVNDAMENIVLKVIDQDTGLELLAKTKKYTGGAVHSPIDMAINHLGIFLLANIGDGFQDLESLDTYTTQNANTNFAIIYIDHDGNILEIESYDTFDLANDLGANYPKRLVIGVTNKQQPVFTFLSSRDDKNDYQGGGIFVTQSANNSALFATGDTLAACSSVAPNCELCSSHGCLKCSPGYKLQNTECKLTCDIGYFQVKDDPDDTLDIDICLPCHRSCLTCSDSTEAGCLTCTADKVLNSTKKTCTCDQSSGDKFMDGAGACVSSCGELLTGRYKHQCVRSCLEDSDDYVQRSSLVQPFTKSTANNCESTTQHYKVTEGTTNNLEIYKTRRGVKKFSFTSWVRISSASAIEFDLYTIDNLSLTGTQNPSTGKISISLKEFYNATQTYRGIYNVPGDFSLNEWVYIGVSISPKGRLDELFTIYLVSETLAGVQNQAIYTDKQLDTGYSDIDQILAGFTDILFMIGGHDVTQKVQYTGLLNAINIYSNFQTPVELLSNKNLKALRPNRIYHPDLKISMTLTSSYVPGTPITSQYMVVQSYLIDESSEIKAETLAADPLTLCEFYNIERKCSSISTEETSEIYPIVESLYSQSGIPAGGTNQEDIIIVLDRIDMNKIDIELKLKESNNQSAPLGQHNVIHHFSSEVDKSVVKLAYYNSATKEIFNVGIFAIADIIPAVYPDHGKTLIPSAEKYNFTSSSRYLSMGELQEKISGCPSCPQENIKEYYSEIISFSEDCNNVQPADLKLQRQVDGTFPELETALMTTPGQYRICWKSPMIEKEIYIPASESEWVVRDVPSVKSSCSFNEYPGFAIIYLNENALVGDEFQFYRGVIDCQAGNEVDGLTLDNTLSLLSYFTPNTTDKLHLCWREKTRVDTFTPWMKVSYSNGTSYSAASFVIEEKYKMMPVITLMSHARNGPVYEGEEIWAQLDNYYRNISTLKVSCNATLKYMNDPIQIPIECGRSGEPVGRCYFHDIPFYPDREIIIFILPQCISYTDSGNEYFFLGNTGPENTYHEIVLYQAQSRFNNGEQNLTYSSSSLAIFGINKVGAQPKAVGFTPQKENNLAIYEKSIFYYSSYVISMWIDYNTTSACQVPVGSIQVKTFDETNVYSTNFNADEGNCPVGTEFTADIVVRTTFLPNFREHIAQQIPDAGMIHHEYYPDAYKFKYGCDPSCKYCFETDPHKCIICSEEYPYYNGTTKECFQTEGAALTINKIITQQELKLLYGILAAADESMQVGVWECPDGYYRSHNMCSKCHEACFKCIGPFPEDCASCNFPTPFLSGNTCIAQCDSLSHQYDFKQYSCLSNSDFTNAVASSKPECQNINYVSSDETELMSISLLLNDDNSTFLNSPSSILEMVIHNKRGNVTSYKFTQTFPIPNPADPLTNILPLIAGQTDKYVNETNIVKLSKTTIDNYPAGSKFLIMSEAQNDCGDRAVAYISLFKEPLPIIGDATISCVSSPCKILEQINITLTGDWYSHDSSSMQLYIKIMYELPDGARVYAYPSAWEQKEFSLVMPILLREEDSSLIINIIVTATNLFDNSSTLTKTIIVDNTVEGGIATRVYEDFGIQESIGSESDSLHTVLVPALKPPMASLYCKYDSECSSNGYCNYAIQSCICSDEYTGLDCSIYSTDYSILQAPIATQLIRLGNKLAPSQFQSRVDFEDDFILFCNLLVRPEFVPYSSLSIVVKVFTSVVSMSPSLFSVVSQDFLQAYFNGVSALMVRIKYEYEHMIKNSHLDDESDELALKTSSLQQWEQVLLFSITFLQKLSTKVADSSSTIVHETDVAVFKIKQELASALNGSTYSLDSLGDYNIHFENDCFAGTAVTDASTQVKVVSIIWKVTPLSGNSHVNSDSSFAMMSFRLLDQYSNIVPAVPHRVEFEIPNAQGVKLQCQNYTLNDQSLQVSSSDCVYNEATDLSTPLTSCSNCTTLRVSINCSSPSTLQISSTTQHSPQESHKFSIIKSSTFPSLDSKSLNLSGSSAWIYLLTGFLTVFVCGQLLICCAERQNKFKTIPDAVSQTEARFGF